MDKLVLVKKLKLNSEFLEKKKCRKLQRMKKSLKIQ
jgi:hypothetical protein